MGQYKPAGYSAVAVAVEVLGEVRGLHVAVGAGEAAQHGDSAGGRTGRPSSVNVNQAKGVQMLMPGESLRRRGKLSKGLAVVGRVTAVALRQVADLFV